MNKDLFVNLASLFNNNSHRLYIVGGTSRDYLLSKEVLDYDFATDATPTEMKKFLVDADYTFEKYGSVKLKIVGNHVDITTLRKESKYIDSRHPSQIEFTTKIEEDYLRRDFTINAIYIDENFKVIDFCGGLNDLKNKIIRFIGDPYIRIKEDPLRIIRAERFKAMLGFNYDLETQKAIIDLYDLVSKLNQDKVKEELRKFIR